MRERVDDVQEVRTEKLAQHGPWEGPSTRIDTISSFETEARGDESLVESPFDEMRDGPVAFSAPITLSASRASHVDSSSRRKSGDRGMNRIVVGLPGIEYGGGKYLLKELKVYEQRRATESLVDNQVEPSLEVRATSSSLDLVLAARSESLSEVITSVGNDNLGCILKVDNGANESRHCESSGRERCNIVLPTDRGDKGAGCEERCEQNTTEQHGGIRCESYENNAPETMADDTFKSSRAAGVFIEADSFDYLVVESIWRAQPSESHDPFDDVLVFTTCFDNELEQGAIREALDSIKKRLPDLPTFVPVDAEGDTSGPNDIDYSYTNLVPERVWSVDPFDDIFYFTTEFDFEVDPQEVLDALQSVTNRLKQGHVHQSTPVLLQKDDGPSEPSNAVVDALAVNSDGDNIKKQERNNPARTSLQSDLPGAELCDNVAVGVVLSPPVLCMSQKSSPQLSEQTPTVMHFNKADLNRKDQHLKSHGGADVLYTAADTRRISDYEVDTKARCDDVPAETNLQANVSDSGFSAQLIDGLAHVDIRHCRLLPSLPQVSQQKQSDTVQARTVILNDVKSVDTNSVLLRKSSESCHFSSSYVDALPDRVWSVDPFDEVFYFTTDFDFEIDQHQIQEALYSITTRLEEVNALKVPDLVGKDNADPRMDRLRRDKLDVAKQSNDVTVEPNQNDADPNSSVAPKLLDGMAHSHSTLGSLHKSLQQAPLSVFYGDPEARHADGSAKTNAKHLGEGIGARKSLSRKDDQSKLTRLWHYLEDALVEASMTPESEFDDSEVQLAQVSAAQSATTSSHEFDRTLCDTFNSRGSTTAVDAHATEAAEHLPSTLGELPRSDDQSDTERHEDVNPSIPSYASEESLAVSDSAVAGVAETKDDEKNEGSCGHFAQCHMQCM